MYENQNLDVANYIASHGWHDFVQVNRPVHKTLVRILIANLNENTMISWIGKRKVDLSVKAWCEAFNMPNTSSEEEEFMMSLSKEDLFFRLTGEKNLGIHPFIKINQLHQEADVRLSAQIVMNVLVPKKGSKEQVKIEEGRLLYAMIYGKEINLAKLVVERLKAVIGRKSSPICYGMHLMEIMEKAGVDFRSAGDESEIISSTIDHHTLRRLGYRHRHGGWDHVGKGHVHEEEGRGDNGDRAEEEEELEPNTAQAESTAPSSHPPRPSQPVSLGVRSEIAHLRQFMVEQFHFLQATLMSKLESIESRVQAIEENLAYHPPTSPILSPSHDPKGKAPMDPTPAPHPSPPKPTSPIHLSSSHSPSPNLSTQHTSHTSPEPSPSQFEFAARTPQNTPSSDSEATQSDPTSQPTPPPQPQPEPQPPSSPASQPAPPAPPAKDTATYSRKKRPAPSS